jgi:uncharacterized protein (TIGR02421 family)
VSHEAPSTSGQSLVADVLAELAQDKPVRLHLSGGGRLHLDRRLPFICVYRRRAGIEDRGTEQLVTTEPCHIIVPAEPRAAAQARDLLRQIVAHATDRFGSYLLIEMWSAPLLDPPEGAPPANGDSDMIQPRFEIVAPSARIPRYTIDALSQSLGKDMLPFGGSRVVLGRYTDVSPPGLRPLIPFSELKERQCFAMAIVVRPVYRDPTSQELYPAVLRSIRHHVHSALQQAYFSFTQARTSLRLRHYQALGSRSVLKAVFDIDRQLVEIARSYDLLLQATPVNAESAWREFRRSRFEKRPAFFYRPLPMDPALLKRQLYLIPVERIEDPTLAYLFRQKQDELDRQITLLSDVDTPRFLPESVQIYGGVSDWLLRQARELLDRLPPGDSDEAGTRRLTATEFAKFAQQELGYYQQQRTDFRASVSVRDDMYAGMMVSRDQLLIGGDLRVPRRRVEALLQHEIGTHLVTRYNGHVQPFQQLEIGLAGYDGLQEGLAVLAEYLVGGLGRVRMRVLAGRVVAARQLVDGASFTDTFRTLDRDYGFPQQLAYTTTMRAYRGGGLTKDAVYLRGLLQILRYLREGGELEPLFVGKVAAAHIPLIQELRHRQVIKPPALRARYLDHPQAHEKFQRLRAGMTLLDLLESEQ